MPEFCVKRLEKKPQREIVAALKGHDEFGGMEASSTTRRQLQRLP